MAPEMFYGETGGVRTLRPSAIPAALADGAASLAPQCGTHT